MITNSTTDVAGQKTPAELEGEKLVVRTNAGPAASPDGAAAVPIVADPNVQKVIVAVHGVGDQYSYATIQSVVNQFCAFYGDPAAVPLGSFHIDRPAFSVAVPPYAAELTPFAFAEVYWATIPRALVDEKHTIEESRKWARTIVERLQLRRRQALRTATAGDDAPSERDLDYPLLREVLDEMIQTIAISDRVCSLGEKAGLFTFDLRRLLDDYLGDVQVVTEFGVHRRKILDAFARIMIDVHVACPNAEIYIVAHSEGTVVSFLGLLEALRQATAPEWTRAVRGFMTIGSPIDKHLAMWPELFADPKVPNDPPADPPSQPIQWRNYYDYGDPIGFALDDARRWLDRHGWRAVFDFTDAPGHDNGFARYAFPGKAHVDYWTDGAVFGHFIRDVVAPSGAPGAKPPAPPNVRWKQLMSYVVPYLGIAALVYVASYVLYKAVVGALAPEDVDDVSLSAALLIVRRVSGIAALVVGTTLLARVYRLGRTALWSAFGLAAGLAGGVVYVWSVRELPPLVVLGTSLAAGVATAAVALVLGGAAALFTWRLRTFIWSGTIGAAVVSGYRVSEVWNTTLVGSVWPLLLAILAFMYIWWLASLLFDLVFIWHYYIRHSHVVSRIRDVVGRPAGAAAA